MAENGNGNGLELTKGDASIKVKGREAALSLLIVSIVLGGGWTIIQEVQAHDAQAMEKIRLMQESHALLIQNVDLGHMDLQDSI